jgi:glycosyltransferase involved in cell wall biosynthesis
LICAGSTYDYRWPRYFEELRQKAEAFGLSSQIWFLGKIPKIEQIAIMPRAVAVVQPTLFEGGPGGGSVYDAVAVGTRVIASDIPVNREIEHETVCFSPVKSAEALAEEMQRASSHLQSVSKARSDRSMRFDSPDFHSDALI